MNYKIIAILRIFKAIIDLFVTTFFVMYFLSISDSNILSLGIFYLIMYAIIFATIFALRNFCKSKYRVNLLRLGILFNLVFFLLIFILQEDILLYIPLIAIIYGLEEGFYYSVYNNFESCGVNNKQRAKFMGVMEAVNSVVHFLIPLVFGSIMSIKGFQYCLVLVLACVVVQLICSMLYKDSLSAENKKCDLKAFYNIAKENIIIKKIYKTILYNGVIYSGAFSLIITIYIIRVFSDSMSFGIFTAIFALITTLVGILFAKYIKPSSYINNIKLACVLTIIGIVLIAISCNPVTVIIFNLLQSYSKTIIVLINSNSSISISNIDAIKGYKVEYFLGLEKRYFFGRMIGYILFIMLAISASVVWTDIVLGIFAIIIILLTRSLISLEKEFVDNKIYIKE